jgi:hypothetical protein
MESQAKPEKQSKKLQHEQFGVWKGNFTMKNEGKKQGNVNKEHQQN